MRTSRKTVVWRPSYCPGRFQTLSGGGKIGGPIFRISKLEWIPPERAVIMEFEGVEAAQNAFQSNQANEEKLQGGVDRVMFVLEGV